MPPPDSDWPIDILDIDVAAVLEASVDPIADALVDNRRDANAARLGTGSRRAAMFTPSP